MRDVPMICVTVVTDDSTGVWDVGELEYSVHNGPFRKYIERYGQAGLDNVIAMLDELKGVATEVAALEEGGDG